MTNDELNEYIKHYLEEDKTHSAIMLTAPWGTGKSYYIQNKLMPFIDSDEEKRCIVVSLYGLKDLHEISKSIYLEIRAKAFAKKSEKLSTGKLIGKTIIKGIASFFNVDLSMKEEDLQKMYESIDLTGKLIILEDLERSNIDIIEIMGYVNNLVEQDGVKVLLVANEEEIIKEEKQKIESESEAVKNILDGYSKQKELPKLKEDAKDYLHIKEKTISDTINFVAPLSESIKQIMASFDCEYFDTLLQEKNSDIIKEIIGKIGNQQNINLRSFIFACQKTTDILNYGKEQRNIEFAKALLLSNVAFSIKFKSSDSVKWKNILYTEALTKFGCTFYCSYNYIFNQEIDIETIRQEEKDYLRSKKLQEEKNNQDQDFQVLSIFYYKTEIEIIEAVKRIRDRLKIANGISPTTFGELANYLIAVKPLIDCVNVIDECKQLILTQLQSCENDVRIHIAHHNGIELWEQSQKDEYSEFTKQMLDAINLGNAKQLEFDYTIDDLREFSNRLWDYRNKYSHQNPTIKLKADLLVELLKKCTAYDIHQVRLMLKTNYENPQGITDTTKEEIQDIRNAIEQLLNHNEFDSIQKWQIHWIVNDLNRILESIEG
jgi:hypothetical protein